MRKTRFAWESGWMRAGFSACILLTLSTFFVDQITPLTVSLISSAHAGNGNGNAGGNGNGNSGGNGGGNGNGNGLGNGITNGNGIGIGLGDGVGLGVGIANGDTIGVGIGISLGDDKRSIGKGFKDKGFSGSSSAGGDDWEPGNGLGRGRNNGPENLHLNDKFDPEKISKGLGSVDVNELSKLLDGESFTGVGSGPDAGAPAVIGAGTDYGTSGRGLGGMKADRTPKGKKFQDNGDEDSAGSANTVSNGLALGKTKEKTNNGNGLGLGKTKEKTNNGNGLALGKTKEKTNNGKALGKNKAITEAAGVAAAGGAVAAESEDKSASGLTTPMLRRGSYSEREVLALGLTTTGLARVKALGFSVSETGLEQDRRNLVSLYTPEGLDTLSAIRLLRRELPQDIFHLNRIYRPYNTASKDDLEKLSPPGGNKTGRCSGDRCYGRTVIDWKDRFADCARDIAIGIIDTDVDLRHPAFAGQKIKSKAFLTNGRTDSSNWHGTGVLALLAGRPDSSTPGLIPNATFFVANVFFTDGNGETITDTVALLKSLEWMNASSARLINMSFSGPEDELFRTRLKAMRANGFVFTAAAGNEGPAALPTYPAAYPEVVAVTAVTKDLQVYPSANRGPHIDLAAPGVHIWTAFPGGREGYRTGTSFAAPFVTAVLALEPSDLMLEPKNKLLDHLKTVSLGTRRHEQVYGRGLLIAPAECPDTGVSASNWAPFTSSVGK